VSGHANILYWFPKQSIVPAEFQARLCAANGTPRSHAVGAEGPQKGVRGLLVSRDRGAFCEYRPSCQRWDKVGGKIWIGADKTADPLAFARPEEQQVQGRMVMMGDGHEWKVPIANPFAATCTLPTWDAIGEDGKTWIKVVQDRYEDIGQRAADIAADMRKAALEDHAIEHEVPDAVARQLLADALAINYDVTLLELSVLRIFTQASFTAGLFAIIDWREMMAAMKAAVEEGSGEATPFGAGDPGAGSGT